MSSISLPTRPFSKHENRPAHSPRGLSQSTTLYSAASARTTARPQLPADGKIGPPATMEGLDGIRALAVAAVIIFHADLMHFLPGGFLGVDVFFVLSGFLITSSLLKELNKSGTIGFMEFYRRRTRRLMPALLAVLVVCAAYTSAFARDAISALRNDIPPALLYLSNVWQIVDTQSYFERFGRPHALQHLWSLGIEGQFYFVWPLALLGIFNLRKVMKPAFLVGIFALVSMAWMAWLAEIHNIPYDGKPERLYFGTDTHAMGLLTGAWLASGYRPPASPTQAKPWLSDILGTVALIFLLSCFVFLDNSLAFLYRGGFASVSLATACLILGVMRQGVLSKAIFRHPIMEWIGLRSYSLYLWHWPVFVYFRPGEELPGDMAVSFLIRLGLTLVLAHASYRFVEQPLRKHGLQVFGRFMRIKWAGAGLAIAAVFGTLHFIEVPPTQDGDLQAALKDIQTAPRPAQAAMPTDTPDNMAESVQGEAQASAENNAEANPPVNPEIFINRGNESGTYKLDTTDIRITALGDSVMLGTRSVLTRTLPIAYLDAKVGRQGSDLLKLVRHMNDAKLFSDVVLIHIGTNGYIYEQNLRQILDILHDRKQILFINVHADRRWTDDNNSLLRKYQKLYGNITLLDWNAASQSHLEYFVKDGIHLTGKGMAAYAEMVRVAVGVPEMPPQAAVAVVRPTATKKPVLLPMVHKGRAVSVGNTPTKSEENKSAPVEAMSSKDDGV